MTTVTRLNPDTIAQPTGYSQTVLIEQHARRVICAGQIGIAPDGTVPGTAEAQIAQAFTNLRNALAAHGMTPANVVKVTAFLTTREWLVPYRAARSAFFPTEPPASTLLFVAGLADPAYHFEIEAEAIG